jgi:hypothetical protein
MTPTSKSFLLSICLCLATLPSLAQKKLTWQNFLERVSTDSTRLVVGERDSLIITWDGLGFDRDNLRGASMEGKRLVVRSRVLLDHPRMRDERNGTSLKMENLHFNEPVSLRMTNQAVWISNCIFEKGLSIWLENGLDKYCQIEKITVNGQFFFLVNDYRSIELARNTINTNLDAGAPFMSLGGTGTTRVEYIKSIADTLRINGEKVKCWDLVSGFRVTRTNLNVRRNTFGTLDCSNIELHVNESNLVSIVGNRFLSDVALKGTVNSNFVLSDNNFSRRLSISDLIVSSHNEIQWDDIQGHLAVSAEVSLPLANIPTQFAVSPQEHDGPFADTANIGYFYGAGSDAALLDRKNFDKMMETYKTLYDGYKSKGNLISSNACFVAAKDLEGRRLAAIYHESGGFKNYFSWKLNRLMKFYTNHATEPALAIVVSFYMLFGFAVFYFFFPSEWDIESKGRLIQHYRDFVQKNDKGYFKPFLRMIWGFIVSFFNALTLSLNSFVTLGFGNIPTKGLARYVCIIQGFIGWFLLSIFTVALFNQVLF